MHVTVISPEASVFNGEADSVIAPAYDGEVGILPRHAPFMTLLGRGTLQVRRGGRNAAVCSAGRISANGQQHRQGGGRTRSRRLACVVSFWCS